MKRIKPPKFRAMFIAAMLSLGFSPFVYIVLAAEPLYDEWNLPRWVDSTASFSGSVPLVSKNPGEFVCYYQYPDGTNGKVEFVPGEGGLYTFSIPAL